MDATITSFRRGRHTQRTNQFLLEIPGVDSREKGKKLVGKKVVWTSPARRKEDRKRIIGKITACHGSKGVVRARFTRGLPGEAVTTKVRILSG